MEQTSEIRKLVSDFGLVAATAEAGLMLDDLPSAETPDRFILANLMEYESMNSRRPGGWRGRRWRIWPALDGKGSR